MNDIDCIDFFFLIFCSIYQASKKIVDQALSVAMNETAKKSPVNVPTSTPRTPSEKPAHIITTDPRYRNPFKHGWRRELVFRANIDNKQKLENKGEVYYHSPNGKKLRSKGEIMNELRDLRDQNLHINDFTFAKESIGMPPDLEIVRKAKIQTPSQRSKPVVLPEPTPDVLGKRIPKPKMPKGASPPPPPSSYTANKSRVFRLISFIRINNNIFILFIISLHLVAEFSQ